MANIIAECIPRAKARTDIIINPIKQYNFSRNSNVGIRITYTFSRFMINIHIHYREYNMYDQ